MYSGVLDDNFKLDKVAYIALDSLANIILTVECALTDVIFSNIDRGINTLQGSSRLQT